MSGPRRRGASPLWGSLRIRLALLGFLAGYLPVLILFGVVLVTETDTTITVEGGMATRTTATNRSSWVSWTVVALGPLAAAVSWWWAGRAVRPIERIRTVAEEIEESDLSRRIGLGHGPTEIVSLAASFDAMLGRLERAADLQRRLIEETSHELRTPLSVLTTNADVLLAHPDPSVEVWREGLRRSRRAADRLQATIDELLIEARGRARTLDRAPADLTALARGVVEDAAVLAAAEGLELRVAGAAEAICSVDELTVRRALSNLVENAIRYASDGVPPEVEVRVELAGAEAAIVVTDHGPGIPREQQEHIFERFWRGHDDMRGAGLGLPIAYQIAEAHGGRLTVASPGPGGAGCVFRLSLRR
ncbi:HAMP domain-containing sensor histidine kinase [Streptomyces profundus]|uniref:HAMP domain-containing sensor histidine kinase n=1 Tax=Streptomyces profundus TaxID=2867410 RepID=UPI001D16EE9E|nr:HAMP domain-containing sensor histidine kinase [Streptomyces sp. MA3_2.13]UED83906.1 HAMP domain-containing histidine kinase [Streptomyces sp. MA3_2.13]